MEDGGSHWGAELSPEQTNRADRLRSQAGSAGGGQVRGVIAADAVIPGQDSPGKLQLPRDRLPFSRLGVQSTPMMPRDGLWEGCVRSGVMSSAI